MSVTMQCGEAVKKANRAVGQTDKEDHHKQTKRDHCAPVQIFSQATS